MASRLGVSVEKHGAIFSLHFGSLQALHTARIPFKTFFLEPSMAAAAVDVESLEPAPLNPTTGKSTLWQFVTPCRC